MVCVSDSNCTSSHTQRYRPKMRLIWCLFVTSSSWISQAIKQVTLIFVIFAGGGLGHRHARTGLSRGFHMSELERVNGKNLSQTYTHTQTQTRKKIRLERKLFKLQTGNHLKKECLQWGWGGGTKISTETETEGVKLAIFWIEFTWVDSSFGERERGDETGSWLLGLRWYWRKMMMMMGEIQAHGS